MIDLIREIGMLAGRYDRNVAVFSGTKDLSGISALIKTGPRGP